MDNLRIASCHLYAKELSTAVDNLGLKNVETATFKSICWHPAADKTSLYTIVDSCEGFDLTVLLCGTCVKNSPGVLESMPENMEARPAELCQHRLLNKTIVDGYIKDGAYLVTPGWLESWKREIDHYGFDNKSASEFFGETTKKIVLLSAFAPNGARKKLKEFSEYVGVPCETVHTGLDLYETHIKNIYMEWESARKERELGEKLNGARKVVSDSGMKIDMLNRIALIENEAAIFSELRDFFTMLFAAERVEVSRPSSAAAGKKGRAAINAGANMSKHDNGFSFNIAGEREIMAVVTVINPLYPEYDDQYKETLSTLSSVIGLAIKNARRHDEKEKLLSEISISRNWFSTTLKSIGDGVIATNKEGKVIFMNDVAETMTGWKVAEAEGVEVSRVLNIINESSRKTVDDPVKKVLETGRIVALANHTMLISKDGEERHIMDSGAPIKNAGGDISGVVLVFSDITERRMSEIQRESLQNQLQHSQRMETVGMLAGGIAHEFNNMLTVIMATTELMLMATPDNTELRDDLETVYKVAEKSKSLTMKLLTFARKDMLDVVNAKVSEILEETLSMFKRHVVESIKLDVKIVDDCVAIMDRTQIQQALLNIVNNATDALPNGGKISVRIKEVDVPERTAAYDDWIGKGRYCRISVEDNGTGIPPELVGRVCEPFMTTKGIGKGTGLGMSVTHGIIKAHKGFLDIKSKVGKGTTVSIYLPLSKEAAAAPEKKIKTARNTKGNETVLVIDDEPLLREIVSKTLEKSGYKTIAFECGARAIMHLQNNPGSASLAILDMMMDEMDGLETFQQLRRVDKNLKVVISSGFSVDGRAKQAMNEGATAFIQKPFTITELLDVVRDAIDAPVSAGI